MPDVSAPEVNLLELNTIADPFPIYAEWRRAGPVVKGAFGMWGVTHHAQVSTLIRDRRLGHRMPWAYTAFALGDGPSAELRHNTILNTDPPDHTRLRRLMGTAFSAPLVRGLRDHIGAMVDDLLEPLLAGAPFDVVTDLAFPLPSQVICELLGIEGADRDQVRDVAAGLTSPDHDVADRATIWFREYMSAVLAERRADADGDLLQRMLAAEEGDDCLSHAEIVDNAALLFFAGFETTKHLIAAGCAALFEFPDQQQRLWADPELAPRAVEEFLRFRGPVPFVHLFATQDLEIAGQLVAAEQVVTLLLACANRDETAFATPDRLDIARDPNPHVAFGGGLHHCMGAQLARVEADVVFRRLAQRVRTFEPAGPAGRQTDGLGAYATVPVRARPASRTVSGRPTRPGRQ